MVLEVTSAATASDDLSTKKDLYEQIGIQEYFLHDVLEEYLDPRLQGYQLVEGRYRLMRPGLDGSLVSATTGLILKPEPTSLRLIDSATGRPLLSYEESITEIERLCKDQG
jgi:hypothetical protein